MGGPETIRRSASADNKFGIRAQNKSVKMAADAGYSVVQQPKETLGRDGKPLRTEAQRRDLGLNPREKPDALINGRVFDVYSPTSKTVLGVCQEIKDKSAIIKPTGFWSIWREPT